MKQKEIIFIPQTSQSPLVLFHNFCLHYDRESTGRRSVHGFGVGELFGFVFPERDRFFTELGGHTAKS